MGEPLNLLLLGGIHFRSAVEDGIKQGNQIGGKRFSRSGEPRALIELGYEVERIPGNLSHVLVRSVF
jgi:hypothetical protein